MKANAVETSLLKRDDRQDFQRSTRQDKTDASVARNKVRSRQERVGRYYRCMHTASVGRSLRNRRQVTRGLILKTAGNKNVYNESALQCLVYPCCHQPLRLSVSSSPEARLDSRLAIRTLGTQTIDLRIRQLESHRLRVLDHSISLTPIVSESCTYLLRLLGVSRPSEGNGSFTHDPVQSDGGHRYVVLL